MGAVKLRILLCVVFIVIVSLVALAINYRTTPLLPAIDLPPSNPIAIGTPLPPDPTPTPEQPTFVGRVSLIIPVAVCARNNYSTPSTTHDRKAACTTLSISSLP